MQTMAPTDRAIGAYASPVQPSPTKSRHVRISVAIVIPEIGLDDDPINPVIREDTVAKKNPKMRMSTAAMTFPVLGSPGASVRKTASRREPPSTTAIGTSRSVRVWPAWPTLLDRFLRLPRADETIVGIVRARVMRPEASTAPAPM